MQDYNSTPPILSSLTYHSPGINDIRDDTINFHHQRHHQLASNKGTKRIDQLKLPCPRFRPAKLIQTIQELLGQSFNLKAEVYGSAKIYNKNIEDRIYASNDMHGELRCDFVKVVDNSKSFFGKALLFASVTTEHGSQDICVGLKLDDTGRIEQHTGYRVLKPPRHHSGLFACSMDSVVRSVFVVPNFGTLLADATYRQYLINHDHCYDTWIHGNHINSLTPLDSLVS
ncbi:hypothetical protein [Absidia glauca]|uniref:Uncharacterized protein n=1 Tax=Absidia glauca TaxID=4829 RepID=A0A163KS02_ABSGL|nr:hypothetical protein [Absidia glauca]